MSNPFPDDFLVDPSRGSSPTAVDAFDRDRFLLRQKVLTISEKYDVCDEQGNPILYIERPSHFLRSLGAVLVGLLAGIFTATLLGILASAAPQGLRELLTLCAMLAWFLVTFGVIIALSPKRHVTLYRDKSRQEPLLKVLQDQKF
ncbi:MAG: hypothetical protein VKJ24_13545, partial [Synechococcales bacterium]|nr:hypothetical protein [Synechococcales bacterium]